MRLIDADKFEAFMYQNDNDDFDNGVQFVLEMIDKAPTVCDIEQIRAELHATSEMHEDGEYYLMDNWIDEIIDKYINYEH